MIDVFLEKISLSLSCWILSEVLFSVMVKSMGAVLNHWEHKATSEENGEFLICSVFESFFIYSDQTGIKPIKSYAFKDEDVSP